MCVIVILLVTTDNEVVKFGPIAQLVRALPCHGRGRRFKSGQGRKKFNTVTESLRATLLIWKNTVHDPFKLLGCSASY